jgi:hypothetical protein
VLGKHPNTGAAAAGLVSVQTVAPTETLQPEEHGTQIEAAPYLIVRLPLVCVQQLTATSQLSYAPAKQQHTAHSMKVGLAQ